MGQAVDFVDEQDVVLLEVGQDGCEVPRTFDDGTGGHLDVDPQLTCNDVGQSRLAQPGGTVEEDMIQRLPPGLGSLDEMSNWT